MKIDKFRDLLGSLNRKREEQVLKDPFGGRALTERIKASKEFDALLGLNPLTQEDLDQIVGGSEHSDEESTIYNYLKSLIDPETLTEEQVKAINGMLSDSKVTANTSDFDGKLDHLSELVGNSEHRLLAGMSAKIELNEEKNGFSAKLSHKDVKADGKEVANLLDEETEERTYSDAVPSDKVKGSIAFMQELKELGDKFLGNGKEDKVVELTKDPSKVDSLFKKAFEIKSTIEKDTITLTRMDLPPTARDLVDIKKIGELTFQSKAPEYVEIKQADYEALKDVDASVVSKINEIGKRQSELAYNCTKDGFEEEMSVEKVLRFTSLLKYMNSEKYGEQNAVMDSKVFDTIAEISKQGLLAEDYESFKTSKIKAFEDSEKAKAENAKKDKTEGSNKAEEKVDGSKVKEEATEKAKSSEKTKSRNVKEVFEIIDTCADNLKAIRSEIVKSDEYLAFIEESKKIDTTIGKVRTLFDSRRAISKPLYAVLTALVIASSTILAPVAYTAGIMAVALSAFVYAAGKILTIRDISRRNNVKMSEVSSSALTASSKWEVGSVFVSTTAAALLGPLGLAAYSSYLSESVRVMFSLFVSTSVYAKELSVNMKTPRLMSGQDFQGTISEKQALEQNVNPVCLTEALNASKIGSYSDKKVSVSDKVKDPVVKDVLGTMFKISGNVASFLKKDSELEPTEIAREVSDLVKSDQFISAQKHDDLGAQVEGKSMASAFKNFAKVLVQASKLDHGNIKAEEFKAETLKAINELERNDWTRYAKV